jgi:glycosyltransferase involved in cell wall biosynthesis
MMLISICIPCHNRTYDLKKIMPSLIAAANASPPVEIMILDYNSPDDLSSFMLHTKGVTKFVGGSALSCKKYTGRDYYHMAHARNLSVLASSGEFVVIFSTDIILHEDYFKVVRKMLKEEDYTWLHHHRKHLGITLLRAYEFVEAGGFDERFEFYGKEDKDLLLRLKRRGNKFGQMPSNLLISIPTPRKEKYKNYRLSLNRPEIYKRSKAIYEENIKNEVLVANKGGWGSWE